MTATTTSTTLQANQPAPVSGRTALIQLGLLLLLAYGIEGWLVAHATTAADSAKARGLAFDNRTFSEIVFDMRQQGVQAYPDMSIGNVLGLIESSAIDLGHGHKAFPLAGISNSPVVMGNENGQYIVYDSDERGFNNPKGLWNRPLDLAAIGDSFTEGCCVPLDKSYTGRLRSKSPRFLNLGIHTSGPLVELAVLREYLMAVKPKTVLWFFHDNDMVELETEKNTLLTRYLDSDFHQGLSEMQPDIDGYWAARSASSVQKGNLLAMRRNLPPSVQSAMVDANRFATLSALRFNATTLISGGPAPRDYELLGRVLMRAKKTVESFGGEMIFVYVPGWDCYDGFTGLFNAQREEVLKTAVAQGLPVIDIYPALNSRGPNPTSLFAFTRSHYTEEGHRVAFEAIAQGLERLKK